MNDVSRYTFEVFWSDEDEGYIAVAPDLPGCSAFGETRAQALEEISTAADAWIEAAHKAGNPVPQPSARQSAYSGKVLLRIGSALHERAAKFAEREGTSLNLVLASAVAFYLGNISVTSSTGAHSSAMAIPTGSLSPYFYDPSGVSEWNIVRHLWTNNQVFERMQEPYLPQLGQMQILIGSSLQREHPYG